MSRKQSNQISSTSKLSEDVETLYAALIRDFYEREDREQARKNASKLEKILTREPDFAHSIRGEEIRSLIAELNGKLQEAIRRRECEIRKILELHSLASGKPSWDYVFRQYDYSDVSDRLDLLAALHANAGDWEQAIATLRESKAYCDGHGIPFDGQDLLDEFEEARPNPKGIAKRGKRRLEQIDKASRDADKEVGVSSDKILSNDDESHRLHRAVIDRVLSDQTTRTETKQGSPSTRKRGQGKGLPSLMGKKNRK